MQPHPASALPTKAARDTKPSAEEKEMLTLLYPEGSGNHTKPMLHFKVHYDKTIRRFPASAGTITYDLFVRVVRYLFGIDAPITLTYRDATNSKIIFDTEIEFREMMMTRAISPHGLFEKEVFVSEKNSSPTEYSRHGVCQQVPNLYLPELHDATGNERTDTGGGLFAEQPSRFPMPPSLSRRPSHTGDT